MNLHLALDLITAIFDVNTQICDTGFWTHFTVGGGLMNKM